MLVAPALARAALDSDRPDISPSADVPGSGDLSGRGPMPKAHHAGVGLLLGTVGMDLVSAGPLCV